MRRRSSGTWARPAARARRGAVVALERERLAVEADGAATAGRACRRSDSSSSDWPLPATPAMPTISPARTEKLTSLTRGDAEIVGDDEVLDLEQDLAGIGRALFDAAAGRGGRPSARPVRSGEVSAVCQRLDHRALAHDRHLVGDRHDLAQLVGDEDDGLALVAQRAEDAEQVVGLGRASARRWARRE